MLSFLRIIFVLLKLKMAKSAEKSVLILTLVYVPTTVRIESRVTVYSVVSFPIGTYTYFSPLIFININKCK